MQKLHKNGMETTWISETPTENELSRLNIDQLLIICRHKKRINNSFKKYLIDYILNIKT